MSLGDVLAKVIENIRKNLKVQPDNTYTVPDGQGSVLIMLTWKNRQDGPSIESYYPTGILRSQTWTLNGTMHRLDGPADRRFHPNGKIMLETWYKYGVERNPGGFSQIKYYDNGNIQSAIRKENGQAHRIDGPVWTSFYKNGKPKEVEWGQYGKQHRPQKDGPAVTKWRENGTREYDIWMEYGQANRDYEPAYMEYSEEGQLIKGIQFKDGIPLKDSISVVGRTPDGKFLCSFIE